MKLRNRRFIVDQQHFDPGDLGIVFKILTGERVRKCRMVRAACEYPRMRRRLEIGLRSPKCTSNGQLWQIRLWFDAIDLIDNHTETIAHVNYRCRQARAFVCSEHQPRRVGFAADAKRMDFDTRLN